ncbi:hypothetical protein CRUP_016903, partial [Coryphaenoides rupestris]
MQGRGLNDSTVGVLASTQGPRGPGGSDGWQAAVLLYNSNDSSSTANTTTTDYTTLTLKGLAAQNGLVYVTYYLDNNDPHVEGPWPVPAGDSLTLELKLALPSVLLVHVCARPRAVPEQVNGLRFIKITKGQVLIVWSDHCMTSKCILTFEVEFSRDGEDFHRINAQRSIFTSYVYSPVDQEVRGVYRVRALDYWGRPGSYSPAEPYSQD